MRFGQFLAVAAVGAAVFGILTDVSPVDAAVAAAASASLVLVPFGRRLRYLALLGFVAAAVAGHSAVARRRALTPDTGGLVPTAAPSQTAEILVMSGTLREDAQVGHDGGVRLVVDVDRIGTRHGWQPGRFRVQAYVSGDLAAPSAPAWSRGRTIQAPMTVRHPRMPRNPGGAGPRWQALQRGYHFTGSIKSALLVDVTPGGWLAEAAARVRQHVRNGTDARFSPAGSEYAAVVTAILIGDRGGLSPDTVRRLQRAGTYHVIAISGGNVALLAGAMFLIGRLVLRSDRAGSAVAGLAVVAYGSVVHSEPSVARATTAAVLYLGASACGVRPAWGHAFALVAVVVACTDPLSTIAPGAWLSYGATLGILLLTSRLVRLAVGRHADRRRWLRAVVVAHAGLLAATAAAELALFPISTTLFARVTLAGFVLNFFAIPAMALVQGAGIATVLLSGWWPSASTVPAAAAALGVEVLLGSARLVDAAPWLSWRVAPPAGGWVVLFYGAAGMIWIGWSSRRLVRLGLALAVVAGTGILTGPERLLARPATGWLRMTMIDVGQGEALLVQAPSGQALLVDAGMASPAFDTGERVVARALWALGVRSLDWAVVTHPDLDHIGGMASVVEIFGAREIWEGVPVPQDPERARLRTRAADTPWREVRAGDRLSLGAVGIAVLHPPAPDWERQRVRNDDSIVLHITYGDVEFLLTGDVGSAVEDHLLDDVTRRPIRVLKIAHHGSRTSTGPHLVARYAPMLALVSAGSGNVFGHPSPEVVDRLEAAGTRVFGTDWNGAVIVETDGREVRARTWTGETWRSRVWRSGS